ncbi:hypothetical protein JCM15548_14000 [Geofilum rubicundum JCM 15548]|uniref:ATP-grasp domain-containing protein n=1 Tax=Geofilum rubicundum JCM 15548 TaxID=1236989 RepID=A0A0E9M375_9BACT|nr:hypothetical protein JCM15548_14000 [Geofilum rubicundum JCM 15548]
MIILDHPYVSKFLEETLIRTQTPVLRNAATRELGLSDQLNYLSDAAFVAEAQKHPSPLIYTNSENPIEWISNHLQFTGLPRHIQNFKDKVKFRELIKGMYPNFYFREIAFKDLDSIDIQTLPLPCIIKPSVGFFSIGVYVINSRAEWPQILQQLKRDVADRQAYTPMKSLILPTSFWKKSSAGMNLPLMSITTARVNRSYSTSCNTSFPPMKMSATVSISLPVRL